MTSKEFKVEHIAGSLRHINKTFSSFDFKASSQDPICILIHNALEKFSRQEMENAPKAYELKEAFFSLRNSFVASGLIDKGIFQQHWSLYARWLLEHSEERSPRLYETIQSLNYFHTSPSGAKSVQDSKEITFNMMMSFFSSLDTEKKIKWLEQFYDDFHGEYFSNLKHHVLNSINSERQLCAMLISKMDNTYPGWKDGALNIFLPLRQSYDNENSKFFISANNMVQIGLLLDQGLSFDEQRYEFMGKSMFLAVAQSARGDIITTILPYLTSLEPQGLSIEEQARQIEEQIGKSAHGRLIAQCYNRLKLQSSLDHKEHDNKRPKI